MYKRRLKVEIADTPTKQQTGLMFRNNLGEDDGMLFKFKYPQKLKFWGLNTYIPLSIAFINKENKISKISYISPFSTKAVSSDNSCNIAIEANYDFFTRNKIKEGDNINIIKDRDTTFVSF